MSQNHDDALVLPEILLPNLILWRYEKWKHKGIECTCEFFLMHGTSTIDPMAPHLAESTSTLTSWTFLWAHNWWPQRRAKHSTLITSILANSLQNAKMSLPLWSFSKTSTWTSIFTYTNICIKLDKPILLAQWWSQKKFLVRAKVTLKFFTFF